MPNVLAKVITGEIDRAVALLDPMCDAVPKYIDDAPTARMLPFANRFAAGRLLGRALGHHAQTDAVVLGIARGGLAVAAGVAQELALELDVWIARKLHPLTAPKLVLGAISEGAGVVIDRVAIVAGNRVIKDSDIARDIRITSFLNGEQPDFTPKSRRASANRLIDQLFIRSEIEVGQYPVVPPESDVERLLAQTSRERRSEYRISDEELKEQLLWQLTVLRFIELRFRPTVLVSDEDIQKYRREHPNERGKDRNEIEEAIAAERVNQNFYSWLNRRRREMKIVYHEEELR